MIEPWEETWVHDTRDERYVVLEPDGPARTVLMSMDLKRPMNLPVMHARAKLASAAPALARAVRMLLEHQCDGLACPMCETAKDALRQGGVPLE